MKIDWVRIKGFRNFDDETIHFANKTLIIGANDVGKTNLLYALRIFFDKSLNENDLELTNNDYNAYINADKIEILVALTDVKEDCLLSIFQGDVENNKVFLKYTNSKTEKFSFWSGFSSDVLEEKTSRFYIRRLNMECVDTNRDLFGFLRRERNNLLEIAKQKRTEDEIMQDEQNISSIQTDLNTINNNIEKLNYISASLNTVNEELSKLSIHNEDQYVHYVAGNSDAKKMLQQLALSYNTGDTQLIIGGDGRNNQIFLATWISQQKIASSSDHITFFAIEEPEAHLHPHQQRKLSKYIMENFENQVFITTHSSQIASEFQPDSIVRLFTKNKISYAAQGGCCHKIKRTFSDFGHRINAISAEIFFSDGVMLVEGISEVLFYKTLAPHLNIDIERLNLTICAVEGIGFKPYIKICQALNIPFVMRTDNDIFTKLKNGIEYKYFSGISRAYGIYKELISTEMINDSIELAWEKKGKYNEWPATEEIPKEAYAFNNKMREMFENHNIFLALEDLERDLINSNLKTCLHTYYGTPDKTKLIKIMQKRKAENMLSFLSINKEILVNLKNNEIEKPLKRLSKLIEEATHPDDKNSNV